MRDFLATTALLTLVVATPAFAQTAESPSTSAPAESAAQPSAAAQAGDIVVTARKRAESIRDIPGSISAVTSEQLEAKGPVTTTGALLSSVPGVRFNDLASENLAEVSIRGSGTERATGADSGVGLFVNGAYVGSSTLGGRNFKTLDYFDVDRVEVLEGPQGALNGRNSEFGVVNILLAKPKFQNSGYVRDTFTAGLDQNRASAVVNQKLGDTLAVRVGGEVYTQSKGFYYNPNRDSYYDSTKGWVGRAQVRYRSGPVDVTLLVDGQDLKLPTFVNSYVVPAGVNAAFPLGFTQSRFILPHTGDDGLQQKQQRAMLLASYDFGWGTLESTSMFTHWESHQQFAALIDAATESQLQAKGEIGDYPYGQTRTNVEDRTFYQDLHLAGKIGEHLNWVVGGEGLYQRDTYLRTVATTPCTVRLNAGQCTGTPTAPVCVLPLPTATPCPAVFPAAFGVDSRQYQRVYSLAGYASLQYALGNFTLAGEGRYTHDYKTATQTIYALYTSTVTQPQSTIVFDADQPAYNFTFSWKSPDPSHTLIYAKVGTGYRAGGTNNGTSNANAPNPFVFSYANEDTISYEVGVKSNVLRSVYLRVSAYASRTNNAITSIADGCTPTNACGRGQQTFNVNGGTIHAGGLEASLDGRFKLDGGLLSLALNAATQRAHFVSVPAGVAGLPVQGTPVAQIPDWTMSASVDYRHPITRTVNGFVNVSYAGQRGGIQDAVTVATPRIGLSDFDIFGAQVGINVSKMQLALFVRNFTDQEIQVLKFQQAGNPLSVRYNKPRTFGGTLTYRW